MRNLRGVKLTEEFIKKNQLSTEAPAPESLFWKLWNASKSIVDDLMKTDLIIGLKKGNLDPVKFGSFNVSDAYYCFRQSECFELAERRAKEPVLKAFLGQKIDGYVTYNKQFQTNWFLKDADCILPPSICLEYSEYELKISKEEDPIYTLILMLACEYLWPWISEELLPLEEGNIYEGWLKGNYIPEISYEVGNFLDLYMKTNPNAIDEEKAISIYKTAMEYEYRYFVSATE